MQQALENVQQLRQEANIPRKKVWVFFLIG